MAEQIVPEGFGSTGSKSEYPWLAHYPADIQWDKPLALAPLHTLIDDAVSRFSARPCIDFLGRRYSYGQVGELIDRAARAFQDMGVRPGVKVGLCLPNCAAYIISFFAVLKVGGTVVNYNPLYVERELEHQISDSGTEIMVTLDLQMIYPRIKLMLERTGLRKVVVCRMASMLPAVKGTLFKLFKRSELANVEMDDRHVDFDRLLATSGRPHPVKIDAARDIAVLQYTGGTTGVPKGAMLTHANLMANARQVHAWFPNVREGEESMLCVLPFFHVFAMTVAMNFALMAGAELILLPRFEAKQVLKTISSRRPTLLPGVPTMYKALLSHPEVGKFSLRSISYCISGGAPLPMEVKRQFEAATGCTLVEGYGLTEASPVCACNPLSGVNKEGSIGLPLPGVVFEIRSLDDPLIRLPIGEKGQVAVAGANVMAGYWQRPDESEKVLVDGFLLTGDVGIMDEDGYVFLLDRLKDLIICSGYNVYPRVIEEAIYQHPDVQACIVVAVPDEYRGQAPVAYVQVKPGSSLSGDALKEFLKDKISKIEMPKQIQFRAELPKTAVGKLSKKDLLEELAREAARKQAG